MYKYFIDLPLYQQVIISLYAIVIVMVVYAVGYMIFMDIADEKEQINKAEDLLRLNKSAAEQAEKKLGGHSK